MFRCSRARAYSAIALLVLALGAAPVTAREASPVRVPQFPSPTSAGAGTEILWDTWGVPHIFANDAAGLFYAFGYAQMHSHGDKILRLYGIARGRAAEYWGEKYLASDRFFQTAGLPQAGRAGYAAQ